jgi:CRP-like cAMP-binding protein
MQGLLPTISCHAILLHNSKRSVMRMTEKEHIVSDKNTNLRHYAANAIVIQEDTPDDGSIYILEKGRLGVFKGGEMVSEISELGMVVGEMAPILHTTRTATIRTITECEITVYTGDLRERLIERLPPITQKIVMALTKRLLYQTASHAKELERIRDLEEINQQLKKQVSDLTHS